MAGLLEATGGTVSGPKNPADGFQEASLPGERLVLMETWLPHISESWDFVRHRHGNQKHTGDTCYVRSRDTEAFFFLPFPPCFISLLWILRRKKKISMQRVIKSCATHRSPYPDIFPCVTRLRSMIHRIPRRGTVPKEETFERKFVRLGFMGAKSATVAGGEGKDN